MLRGTARWFAIALVAFLFNQPGSFVAFAQNLNDGSCCCKGKAARCCRRSHHGETSGPAFASRECCDQCPVSIGRSQPVTGTLARARAWSGLAPYFASPEPPSGWMPSTRYDAVLFGRPPPSL